MDKRIERLESKIDQVLDKQSEHNSTLTRLTVSVETHEKRSTNLEDIVLPMKKKFDMAEGAMQLVGTIASSVGVIYGVIKIIEFIRK